MATIDISGLPRDCKLPRVVMLFKGIMRREGIMQFWITEMSENHGSDIKSAKVQFDSLNDAYKALQLLDGFKFNSGQYVCPLSARMDSENRGRKRRRSPSPYEYRPREDERYSKQPYNNRYDEYPRERSRSPLMRHEASKLDLEIELLRKQRMIIEEERKILLERKKLELVKEFGPSALKEFTYIEEDRERERERDRRYRAERAPDRRPPPRARPEKRARPPPVQRPSKRNVTQIPQFFLPCKLLLTELKEPMERLGTRKESFLLTKLIRATLRKRLAVVLEGKPIMSAVRIVSLYREKYPDHQDEDFVKRHLKNVRANSKHSEDDDTAAEKGGIDELESNEIGEADAGTSNAVAQSVKSEPDDVFDARLVLKAELNSSTDKSMNLSAELGRNAEQAERPECSRSVGSSEALTLHDDWAEGENGWDEGNTVPQ